MLRRIPARGIATTTTTATASIFNHILVASTQRTCATTTGGEGTAAGLTLKGALSTTAEEEAEVEEDLFNLDKQHLPRAASLASTAEEMAHPESADNSSSTTTGRIVGHWRVNDVSVPIIEGTQPHLVPPCSGPAVPASTLTDPEGAVMPRQELLSLLRWMAQKDSLLQDICLWSSHPGPQGRWLARAYCHYARREMQFLSLSRDTTEADLKQRKEIVGGKLTYADRAAVTAAIRGQVLVLEGLERAERNVLPVINNLLENREMSLDNGLMLVHPKRYDEIAAERGMRDLSSLGLIRVHERFRVVALALATPKNPGNPLDPPLRSRFQAVYVAPAKADSAWQQLLHAYYQGGPAAAEKEVEKSSDSGGDSSVPKLALRVYEGLTQAEKGSDNDNIHLRLPSPDIFDLRNWCVSQRAFPSVAPDVLLRRSYPYELYASCLARTKADIPERLRNAERNLQQAGVDLTTAAAASVAARQAARGITVSTLEDLSQQSQLAPGSTALFVTDISRDTDFTCHISFAGGQDAKSRNGKIVKQSVHCGHGPLPSSKSAVPNPKAAVLFAAPHWETISGMLQSHCLGRHILLVAERGAGKTVLVREFARMLGYQAQLFTQHLYADMTARDLLQRRSTDSASGDSTWELNSLMRAATEGGIAVLDGVDQLQAGVLSTLQSLLVDGNVTLADGSTYLETAQFNALRESLGGMSIAGMAARNVFCIHPSFRVIATARPAEAIAGAGSGSSSSSSGNKQSFLTLDVPSMFDVHHAPNLSSPELTELLLRELGERRVANPPVQVPSFGDPTTVARCLVQAQQQLTVLSATETKVIPLTLRQLVRVMLQVVLFPADCAAALRGAMLVPLLPPAVAARVGQIIDNAVAPVMHAARRAASSSSSSPAASEAAKKKMQSIAGTLQRAMLGKNPGGGVEDESEMRRRQEEQEEEGNRDGLRIVPLAAEDGGGRAVVVSGVTLDIVGGAHGRQLKSEDEALVPHCQNFTKNPMHMNVCGWMAKQLAIGNHVLLQGFQGTAKNKTVDYLLSETKTPRYYIQLHRDTTVSSMTVNPVVEGGKVRWDDSALVTAAMRGGVLVVDEVDKAPVDVVQILRGIVEDKELMLADGRRICADADEAAVAEGKEILLHPAFRLITLANPPGWPFMGNDFFRECGSLFASMVLSQPDPVSQDKLLETMAPNVPKMVRQQLISLFIDLSKEVEKGALQYPFSLREMLAVAKHMSAYPQDGVIQALNNVFNFDAVDEATLDTVRRLVHKNIRKVGRSSVKPLHLAAVEPLEQEKGVFAIDFEEMSSPSSSSSSSSAFNITHDQAPIVASNISPRLAEKLPRGTLVPDYFSYDCGRLRLNMSDFQSFTETRGVLRLEEILAQVGAHRMIGMQQLPNGVLTMLVSKVDASSSSGGDFPFLLLSVQSPDAGQREQSSCPIVKEKACVIQLPIPAATNSSSSIEQEHIHLLRLDSGANDVCVVDSVAGTALWVSPLSGRATQVLFSQSQPACSNISTAFASDGCFAFASKEAPNKLSLVGRGGKTRVVDLLPDTDEITALSGLGHGSWSVSARNKSTGLESHLWVSLNTNNKMKQLQQQQQQQKQEEAADASTSLSASHLAAQLFSDATTASVFTLSDGGVTSSPVSFFATTAPRDEIIALPESKSGAKRSAYSAADSSGGNSAQRHEAEHRVRNSLYLHGRISNSGSGAAETAKKRRSGTIVFDAYRPRDSRLAKEFSATTSINKCFAFNRDSVQFILGRHSSSSRSSSSTPSLGVVDFATSSIRRVTPTLGSTSFLERITSGGSTPLQVTDLVAHPHKFVTMIASSSSPPASSTSSSAAGAAIMRPQSATVIDLDAQRVTGEHKAWTAVADGTSSFVSGYDGAAQIGKAPSAKDLDQWYESPASTPRKKHKGLKHGEEDPDNAPHVGGNNWAGGTGGTDTAGLGGVVGPYRLDKGHTVHQVPQELKKNVPQHVIDQARKMGKEELKRRLEEIGLTERENEQYVDAFQRVQGGITQVQSMLARLKAREGERVWLKNQQDGVWDESKLVESIAGDSNVHRRRVDSKDAAIVAKNRKRILFLVDCSASMYRFNGADMRLTRLIECIILVQESFRGEAVESKIEYSIVGHNGDGPNIELVPWGEPPKNKAERLRTCMKIIAHAQTCWSGDSTVEAMKLGIKNVTAAPGDDYFVFVISDANLAQYGITDHQLSRIIRSDDRVKMYFLMIASIGSQASDLGRKLPAGHGFECRDTRLLPQILQNIFLSSGLLD